MEIERRRAPRLPALIYFNKYIDGRPYLCEAVELSTSGMLVRRIGEPDEPRAAYAVEIAPGAEGEGLWLCAAPVWASGPFEALGFVAQSPRDRVRLEALIAGLGAPALEPVLAVEALDPQAD